MVTHQDSEKLLERFMALRRDTPGIRALDAAQKLGVSECELLAVRVGGDAIRLHDQAEDILASLEPLGEVMALTRNADCVHERKGVYREVRFDGRDQTRVGSVVTPDIDLRLFMSHWRYCFAVREPTTGRLIRKSLQFYDPSGRAVHKIYLTPKSQEKRYDRLVEDFAAKNQPNFIHVEAYPTTKTGTTTGGGQEWEAGDSGWKKVKYLSNFNKLLRNPNNRFNYQVENSAARNVLDLSGRRKCEIVVLVGNRGCTQIHTGPVKKLKEFGPWYNVLDPQFNLHLRESAILSSWVVGQPGDDGVALVVLGKDDNVIAAFFGARGEEGTSALDLWDDIIADLPKQRGR